MEQLFSNSGFHHIAENILLYLNTETLMNCKSVHPSWATILKNPWFWLKKKFSRNFLNSLNEEWKELISDLYGTELIENVILLLTKQLEDTPLLTASKFGDLEIIQFIFKQNPGLVIANCATFDWVLHGHQMSNTKFA